MKFSKLSEYLQKLEKTSSRNTITEILAEVFKEATSRDVDKIAYLSLGRIAPQYEGVELNFAEKMMARAIARAYGESPEYVTREYKRIGDLGNVAESFAKEKHHKKDELSVLEVYERLYKIANLQGEGSQEKKLEEMTLLLKSLDSLSARYVARIPVGKLRLGFSDATILDALSIMEKGDKSARKEIESIYNITADIGKVAKRVKSEGLKGLERVEVEPGVPIRPALAERLPSVEKVAEKLAPKFAVEPKMDGFRIQLHVWGNKNDRCARIFSRNLENVTDMFPEIVEAAKELDIKSGIFDGEAIGYSPTTGHFASFQETVQRKRKHGIEEFAKSMPLKVFLFDVLYLNGKTLLQEPFTKRREILEKETGIASRKNGDTVLLADQTVASSAVELRQFVEQYLGDGLEGVVAKKLDVAYQAGGRGYHWVKFKRHSGRKKADQGLADTVDCVLMGAYFGKGKRAQFVYGGFLLGVPGKDDKYYSLSRLGTGLTDEQFREVKKMVDEIRVEEMPKEYVVDKEVAPDVWVTPQVVLEILADEITLSPRHTAGRDAKGRGYSLRFPRLIKVREDKDPEQATAVGEIRKLYQISR